jgi:carboxyl-terminal processing protease
VQARELVKAQALVPPSEQALAAATSVPDIVKALQDPFARYLDPKRFAMFTQEAQGSYGGIGIRLADNIDGRAAVVSVAKGSPAEGAGIRRGDAIVSVDGVTPDKWTSDEVPVYVRGQVGTPVTLTLARPGTNAPVTLKLTRQQITGSDVTSELIGKVGYIRVFALDDTTGEQVRSAIADLTGKGAKAWVFDLRDNPGGPVQAAVDVTSLFVKDGEVVRSVGRDSSQTYSVSGQTATGAPVVVLVNEYTDSGAEVVATALKAHRRATLLGAKTPGDGSLQTLETLSDGSAISFTVAHLTAPDGTNIAGNGVTPDLVVPMAGAATGSSSTDVQLARAIKQAQGMATK